MRKKLFAILMVTVIAAFAGYNIYQSQKMETISDLMLANVEALASIEDISSSDCDTYCKSDARYTCYISWGSDIDGITCPEHRKR